ncbi:MAG: hypothetical protein Q7T54_05740 [Candidatus Levybacteria bacterium]|nr:hypothetical protein [Candidatus Levybacteria bacterium]
MLKNLLLLSAFSTFVVIILVGLDIYHKNNISSLQDTTKRNILPIDPKFDKSTLDQLKKRDPITVSLTGKSSVISEDSKPTSRGLNSPSPTITQPAASSSGSISQSSPFFP